MQLGQQQRLEIALQLLGAGDIGLIVDRGDVIAPELGQLLNRMPVVLIEYPLGLCFKIGLCQCLAMIPGTSRSGATIAGALLMGTDKRSAAEFSFFLAMPTMAGAFTLDLYKNRDVLTFDDAVIIGAGFVTAFIAGVFVVRYLLDYVSKHGFSLFAYWRILVGTLGLIGLYFLG